MKDENQKPMYTTEERAERIDALKVVMRCDTVEDAVTKRDELRDNYSGDEAFVNYLEGKYLDNTTFKVIFLNIFYNLLL